MAIKKIGILTSGGDCGGLNGVVKGAAQMANSLGITPYVIPNGYAGLYNLVDFDELVELTPSRLDQINNLDAGSEAGHSRVKVKKIDDAKKYDRINEGLAKFGIDGLVISGGDDSGSVLVDLAEQGIHCVHAPKTMDLDLQTYSVGGDSTINRIASAIQDLKTTGRTHNRVIVLEVFGRYAGHTALKAGVAADADCIIIPEVPVDFNVIYDHMKERYCKRILESDVNAGTYVIVVAEGITTASGELIVDESSKADAFGHKRLAGAGKYVRQQLEKIMAEDKSSEDFMKETKLYVKGIYEAPEIREVNTGHWVRCGRSTSYDANFGKQVGAGAVLLLNEGTSGVTVAGIKNGEVEYLEAKKAIVQNHVTEEEVVLHENLGTCFGRKAEKKFSPSFKELSEYNRTY